MQFGLEGIQFRLCLHFGDPVEGLRGLLCIEIFNLAFVFDDLVVHLGSLLGLGERPELAELVNTEMTDAILRQKHLRLSVGILKDELEKLNECFSILCQEVV